MEGTPINNVLYTVEGEESKERTKAELREADPPVERALGVLSGSKDKNESENR